MKSGDEPDSEEDGMHELGPGVGCELGPPNAPCQRLV